MHRNNRQCFKMNHTAIEENKIRKMWCLNLPQTVLNISIKETLPRWKVMLRDKRVFDVV
jgi:hypothetical protein